MEIPQPNSKHCFVCGLANPLGLKLRFFQSGPGEVTTETVISEEYQGYPGVAHGGIVAAILDEVSGRALMESNPPRFMYTARLDIRFRKNVPTGKPIKAIGKEIMKKSRIAKASGKIYDQEGNLLAEAEALLVNIPDELIDPDIIEAEGWQVYPSISHD